MPASQGASSPYNGRMMTTASETRVRPLPDGPFSLAFFGLAFARAWLSLIFAGDASSLPTLSHTLFDAAYVTCGLLVLVFARRLVPLTAGRGPFVAVLAGMCIASGVFVAQPALPSFLAPVLLVLGAILGGAAFAGCTILNAEALAGTSVLRIALYLSGGNLLGSVLVFFLQGCTLLQLRVAVFALPLAAVALIHGAVGSLPAAERQRAGYPHFRLPWKLLLLAAVFTFVYGMRQASLVAGAGRHSTLSTAIVAGLIFAIVYLSPKRLDVAKLSRAPLLLMTCGLLLAPVEGLVGQTVSSYLVSASFTLMRFLVGLMLYDMSRRTGIAIAPLIAANCAVQMFSLLGTALSDGIHAAAGDAVGQGVVTAIVCVVLVASFVLLFSERELEARWGIKVLGGVPLDEMARASDGVLARCDELVATYSLTPREAEIIRELARRRDSAAVARALAIAPGTLRAHTRHIYEKMGIHSREELYELLGLEWGTRE